MKCFNCNSEFVESPVYDGSIGQTMIVLVEDVVYNREAAVLGVGPDGSIECDNNYDYLDNDETISSCFQCIFCGTNLDENFVRKVVQEWSKEDESMS
jgi:hypothetical protein